MCPHLSPTPHWRQVRGSLVGVIRLRSHSGIFIPYSIQNKTSRGGFLGPVSEDARASMWWGSWCPDPFLQEVLAHSLSWRKSITLVKRESLCYLRIGHTSLISQEVNMATFLMHSGHGQRRGSSACSSAASTAGNRHPLFPQAAQSCRVTVNPSTCTSQPLLCQAL